MEHYTILSGGESLITSYDIAHITLQYDVVMLKAVIYLCCIITLYVDCITVKILI